LQSSEPEQRRSVPVVPVVPVVQVAQVVQVVQVAALVPPDFRYPQR